MQKFAPDLFEKLKQTIPTLEDDAKQGTKKLVLPKHMYSGC
jgi:hypothetical protein